MTKRLPLEILTAIFKRVDDVQDLRRVRATNRTLCEAATPLAFSTLFVTPTEGSPENLGQLFDVPEIAAYIKEVSFYDTGASATPTLVVTTGVSSRSVELKSTRAESIRELASTFSRIHQLPRLETINLAFVPLAGLGSDRMGRPALQSSILGALAKSFSISEPSKLTSLRMLNLRPLDLTPLESPAFQAVLKNLRLLQLDGLLDRDKHITAYSDYWVHFWSTFSHHLIITPTQHNLTMLILQSNIPVGATSSLSFAGLHFPHLYALVLNNIVFDPTVGADSFILRHSATLSRLELISCRLPINTVSNSTHWEHIWDKFSEGLTALKVLCVDHSGDGSENRYVRSGSAGVYWEAHVPVHQDEVDETALQRFYATVAARSEEKRNTSPGAE